MIKTVQLNTPECSYAPQSDRDERPTSNYLAIPTAIKANPLALDAYRAGFISGTGYMYAIDCQTCPNACVSLRVDMDRFRPSKSQRRLLNSQNIANFSLNITPANLTKDMYTLYMRYIMARHPSDKMRDYTEKEVYSLVKSRTHTARIFQSSKNHFGDKEQQLFGFAAINISDTEMSFDYLAYDPDHIYQQPGPGNICWLLLFMEAARRGIKHVYLGAGLKDSPKLGYKMNIKGLEYFDGQTWSALNKEQEIKRPSGNDALKRLEADMPNFPKF